MVKQSYIITSENQKLHIGEKMNNNTNPYDIVEMRKKKNVDKTNRGVVKYDPRKNSLIKFSFYGNADKKEKRPKK